MTKWIIVSDNHTEKGILFDVFNHYEEVDVALHLGDSELTYDDTELSYYHKVKGNTDFYQEFPNDLLITENGINAYVTHGHLFQVNQSRERLADTAKRKGCQFAFYGHTHVAKYELLDGVHVINPGSISQSRSEIEETYAELIISDDNASATLNFCNRNHQIIDSKDFEI